jgi:low affinity Fe/Cu permease
VRPYCDRTSTGKGRVTMATASKSSKLFTKLATAIAAATGRPVTFILCCAIVIVWAVSGPIFGFSDTWQLIINTGTTIVTFLMVFLIQNTQNRDGAALQAKLDELIRASTAHNAFIGIEHLTDEELREILRKCEAAAEEAGEELDEHERMHAVADAARQRAAENVSNRLEKLG